MASKRRTASVGGLMVVQTIAFINHKMKKVRSFTLTSTRRASILSLVFGLDVLSRRQHTVVLGATGAPCADMSERFSCNWNESPRQKGGFVYNHRRRCRGRETETAKRRVATRSERPLRRITRHD